MPKTIRVNDLSFRPSMTQGRRKPAYTIMPKGERSLWASKGSLYPASDDKTYVVSMSGFPLDARPNLEQAIDLVVRRIARQERNRRESAPAASTHP